MENTVLTLENMQTEETCSTVIDSISTLGPTSQQLNGSIHNLIKIEEREEINSHSSYNDPRTTENGIHPSHPTVQENNSTITLSLTPDTWSEWRQLGQEKNMQDVQLASFLLHHYCSTREQSLCESCNAPLTQYCSRCFILSPAAQHKDSLPGVITGANEEDENHEMGFPQHCEDQNFIPQGQIKEDLSVKKMEEERVLDDAEKLEGDENGMQSPECSVGEELGGTPVVACAWCDVSFSSINALVKHLSIHTSLHWQRLHQPGTRRSRHRTTVVEDTEQLKGDASEAGNASGTEDEKKPSKCLFCKATLKKVVHFTKHLQKHLKSNAFKCCQCEKTFASLRELEQHIEVQAHDSVNSDSRPHQCGICGLRFTHLRYLANHAKKHPEPNPFWCAHCQQGFPSITKLTAHSCRLVIEGECGEHPEGIQDLLCDGMSLERVQGDDGGDCPIDIFQHTAERPEEEMERCIGNTQEETVTSSGDDIQSQVQTDVNETSIDQPGRRPKRSTKTSSKDQRHKCPDCPATFRHLSRLKIHSQKHTGQNAFPCPQCESSFPCKKQLLQHQEKDHWGSAPITCQQCGKVLKSMMSLEQHLLFHTGERPYGCDVCGESFRSQPALSMHRRTHNPDPFKCRECSAEFLDPASYKVHMNDHAGVKPHLCSVCGDAFAQRYQLKQHMVRHGRKQFVCEHCGSAFYTSFQHKVHVMRHLGIKPFTCELCDKSFVRKGKLKQHHISVHLRTKPYKCNLCDKAYSDTSRLNEHVRAIHTNERPFKCPVCGKAFAKSGCRQAHLRTHKQQNEHK